MNEIGGWLVCFLKKPLVCFLTIAILFKKNNPNYFLALAVLEGNLSNAKAALSEGSETKTDVKSC